MNSATSRSVPINRNCVLRRNVETQPYGRCSVCTLELKQCHAWQSNGYSFALVVGVLALLLVPGGWPQQLVGAALLATVVWQGLVNHRRTDELIHGQHKLLVMTQELRGQQLLVQQHNHTLAAQVDARTAELREANRHLADANLRLAEANLELLELDKLRSAVLSNVSHELRTPLAGILGSAQNLRDGLAGALTPDQRDYVAMIENDSGRLIRVVNELLDWGRLQAGQARLQREMLPLQALVDDVFALLRPAAQRKRVRLAQALAMAHVDADPDKLKQILINLVDNAIKFSPEDATVELRAQPAPGGACLTVQDQGAGIAPQDLPQLFERFFRGRSGAHAPGSGLGLAIARNLARLHGGDIMVQTSEGRGSMFTVRLPSAEVPA